MIEKGLVGREEAIVSLSKCAREMSSGDLDIFATPALVALMEASAINALKNRLGIGETTVGISINVKHTSPTPTGMTVWAESELTEIDGRRLTFKITAYDKSGEIGTATHERMIVEKEKMLKKANSKMNK